ncbi:YuzB family protein [Saccharibacillus sacchari]|uniref:YuzB family protein n=1 Tax=Saccharibacillus sacchari TaxID=456493 RepID=UPI0004B33FC6|nr:YuzB family protein [Saccharibacillus sacchari]
MIRPIIEFCASNMHHGTQELFNKLETNPEYDVIEYGCLGNCTECDYGPYAMVNGDVVEADTIEALEKAIDAKMNEEDPWASLDLD